MKADAEIVCELAETGIEYASAGGETTIDYTTNMGDVYDYSVTYGEPDAGEWLTWSDEGAGRVVLRAAEWTSKSDNRTAVFTIHVGTADTSEASAEIAVVQLRVDDYYYLYGASVPRYEAIDAALQSLFPSGNGIDYAIKNRKILLSAGKQACLLYTSDAADD